MCVATLITKDALVWVRHRMHVWQAGVVESVSDSTLVIASPDGTKVFMPRPSVTMQTEISADSASDYCLPRASEAQAPANLVHLLRLNEAESNRVMPSLLH